MSVAATETLQKSRLHPLRRLRIRKSLANKGARRNRGTVTAPHRNREKPCAEMERNRGRGYAAKRLRTRGYAQSLIWQGFEPHVTVVTTVTARKINVGKFSGGAR
jgi:hypothetical protein